MFGILNRFLSDETRGGTGVRIGPIGNNGRTYVTYGRRSVRVPGEIEGVDGSAKCVWFNSMVFMGIFTLLCFGVLCYEQTQLESNLGSLDDVLKKGVFSLGKTTHSDNNNDAELVHGVFSSYEVPSEEQLRDDDFGMYFSKAVAMRRKTEYCQWIEVPHTHTRVVGHECEPGSDPCREVAITETYTTFSYHKGWRSYLVNSMLFDATVTYHNPQRDPFPSATQEVSHVVLNDADAASSSSSASGYVVSAANLKSVRQDFELVHLRADRGNKFSDHVLREGFTQVTPTYIISPMPEEGFGKTIFNKVVSYFIDGVVDMGDMGTCKAGSIRIAFETSALPSVITVLGQKQNRNLVAWRSPSDVDVFLAAPGSLSVRQLLDHFAGSFYSSAWLHRSIVFALFAAAWIVRVFVAECKDTAESRVLFWASVVLSALFVAFFGVTRVWIVSGVMVAIPFVVFLFHQLPDETSEQALPPYTESLKAKSL